MMFLEVEFENGQVGRYPCSRAATVSVKEPPVQVAPGEFGPGSMTSFALENVRDVRLVNDNLTPVVAENPTHATEAMQEEAQAALVAALEAPPAPPPTISEAETPEEAITAAIAATAAATQHGTMEAAALHAQTVEADLRAALERWPEDEPLQDALVQVQRLVADLTPAPADA